MKQATKELFKDKIEKAKSISNIIARNKAITEVQMHMEIYETCEDFASWGEVEYLKALPRILACENSIQASNIMTELRRAS